MIRFKEPALSMLPTMQALVEDAMYVSQGDIPMSEGDTAYHWSCEESVLTSRYYQLVDVSACPQQRFSAKILTPKDGSSFILERTTNGIYQVNLRILYGPCLFSCV